MSWYCNTDEAKEHKETCTKNPMYCDICVWIDESSKAMGRYGTEIKQEETKTVKKIEYPQPERWETEEDKINYIKKLFTKRRI